MLKVLQDFIHESAVPLPKESTKADVKFRTPKALIFVPQNPNPHTLKPEPHYVEALRACTWKPTHPSISMLSASKHPRRPGVGGFMGFKGSLWCEGA